MYKLIISTFLFVLGISLAYSQNSLLEIPINLKVKNSTISTVFEQISKQTKCYFTYNPDLISKNRRYTIVQSNITINEALKIIFKNKDVKYDIIKDHIVIYKITQRSRVLELDSVFEKIKVKISGKIIDKNSNVAIP